MSNLKVIQTTNAPAAIGPYSQAVVAGDTIYISGQLGMAPTTGQLAEGITAQTKQALENIKAILLEAGANLSNVVKAEVFLTDINDFAKMNEVYAEFFTEPYPSRAAVEVSALPKAAKVEIVITACL